MVHGGRVGFGVGAVEGAVEAVEGEVFLGRWGGVHGCVVRKCPRGEVGGWFGGPCRGVSPFLFQGQGVGVLGLNFTSCRPLDLTEDIEDVNDA